MWARCPRSLFPGLRLGFMVGPKKLIAEARALRRLMVRHAPNNNQRTAALFLSLGHHDTLIRRLHRAYRTRWEIMGEALEQHFPASSRLPSFGGTSFWVKGAPISTAKCWRKLPRPRAFSLNRGGSISAGEIRRGIISAWPSPPSTKRKLPKA